MVPVLVGLCCCAEPVAPPRSGPLEQSVADDRQAGSAAARGQPGFGEVARMQVAYSGQTLTVYEFSTLCELVPVTESSIEELGLKCIVRSAAPALLGLLDAAALKPDSFRQGQLVGKVVAASGETIALVTAGGGVTLLPQGQRGQLSEAEMSEFYRWIQVDGGCSPQEPRKPRRVEVCVVASHPPVPTGSPGGGGGAMPSGSCCTLEARTDDIRMLGFVRHFWPPSVAVVGVPWLDVREEHDGEMVPQGQMYADGVVVDAKGRASRLERRRFDEARRIMTRAKCSPPPPEHLRRPP